MAKNNSSKWGLVKKALYIWAIQYHFVIPKKILSGYIHKFHTENENIIKYGQRYFDPENNDEYQQWLSFQTDVGQRKPIDITLIGRNIMNIPGINFKKVEMKYLDLSKITSSYVGITGDACHFYDEFDHYIGDAAEYDLTYFDHDCIDRMGHRSNPKLKPDFSYDTLRAFNYIGSCWVVRTDLLRQFDGQKWNPYAWLLHLSDQNLKIGHISKILYGDMEQEESHLPELQSYFKEKHINADAELIDDVCVNVKYAVKDEPLVSIVIPTKNGKDVLKTCIDSIEKKTSYNNYEIVIADNGSTEQDSLDYFAELQQNKRYTVFDCSGEFNFSKINNQAILEHCQGEYAVLLNNDTSIISEDWLEQMLSYAQLDHVGSVGVLLYYPDGTIQHGGVITGKGGGFAHRYYRKPGNTKGYMYTLSAANDVACCTAACLMISKKKYEEVGGMNEELTVQFNDADLGVRLLEHGYFNVFLPTVKLIHYESKSRGIDKKKDAVERYVNEVSYAKKHYAEYIKHDPFYNDQFDKNYDYMLISGEGSN